MCIDIMSIFCRLYEFSIRRQNIGFKNSGVYCLPKNYWLVKPHLTFIRHIWQYRTDVFQSVLSLVIYFIVRCCTIVVYIFVRIALCAPGYCEWRRGKFFTTKSSIVNYRFCFCRLYRCQIYPLHMYFLHHPNYTTLLTKYERVRSIIKH